MKMRMKQLILFGHAVNEINIGDVQLVNSKPIEEYENGSIVPNDELIAKVLEETAITENSNAIAKDEQIKNDYFEETRLDRERMYSEMIETYQQLIGHSDTPSDQKAIAVQEISNITNTKNGIMISENLIKNKGFEDVIILVNNGTVSVVVKSYNLNQEQISKIQNIVERELKIDVKNINISNKF